MLLAELSAPVRTRPASRRVPVAVVFGVLGIAIGFAAHSLLSFVDESASVTPPRIVNLQLGTTYVGSTLSIGLSRAVAYVPSDTATGTRHNGRAVTVNIALTNRAATPLPVASLGIQATSGDIQDGDITDPTNNVGTATATVLPGRSLVWQIAFALPANARDITIEISPVDGNRTLAFTGSP
jgi:hypothetical protein